MKSATASAVTDWSFTHAGAGTLTRRTFIVRAEPDRIPEWGLGLNINVPQLTVAERHQGSSQPLPTDLLAVTVVPTELSRGDLVVTDQSAGRVLCVRGERVELLADVQSWSHSVLFDAIPSADRRNVYISTCGIRGPLGEHYGVRGVGMVLELDARAGSVSRVFSAFHLVDPAGLVLSRDQRTLYVADFHGFGRDDALGHGGKIHAIDLESGSIRTISEGKHLVAPVGINPDGDDHLLVGNAMMRELSGFYGGSIVRVNINTGEQTLMHEHERGVSLIGAARLRDGSVCATRSDWPHQQKSAVVRITGDHAYEAIFEPTPGFLSSGIAVDDDGFWVAESVDRQLHKFDHSGTKLATVDLPAPAIRGELLKRASDTVESVRIVA